MNDQSQETAKAVLDGLSVATVIGTLMDILPAVAALFTIIWTGIRIWETDTVRRMLGRTSSDDAE
jgi:hypothetical protein